MASATRAARRGPESSSWMPQASTVAIHAPRLNDRTSGRKSSPAQTSAAVRVRPGPLPSAIPVTMTSPYDTTVAMPITSVGPKVPTARMSSPMYEAPVPVRYWATPTAPWSSASPTRPQATTAKSRRSRIIRSTAAGTRTKICT